MDLSEDATYLDRQEVFEQLGLSKEEIAAFEEILRPGENMMEQWLLQLLMVVWRRGNQAAQHRVALLAGAGVMLGAGLDRLLAQIAARRK